MARVPKKDHACCAPLRNAVPTGLAGNGYGIGPDHIEGRQVGVHLVMLIQNHPLWEIRIKLLHQPLARGQPIHHREW